MKIRLIVLSVFVVLACSETTEPEIADFSGLVVLNACPILDDLGEFKISMLLLGDTGLPVPELLRPDMSLRGTRGVVGDAVNSDVFSFELPPAELSLGLQGPGVAFNDSGAAHEVILEASRVEFLGTTRSSESRKLIILMVDHSSSLIGVDPSTGDFEPGNASDSDDARIALFQSLVGSLRGSRDDRMALVSFNSTYPAHVSGYLEPTGDIDLILDALSALQFDEAGTTPLVPALKKVHSDIIEQHPELEPVVVLFTDGVETASSGPSLDEVGMLYDGSTGGRRAPLVIVDLKTPLEQDEGLASGRDIELAELACRTGGEYIFVPSSAALGALSNDLAKIIKLRLGGAWSLSVQTDMSNDAFADGQWLLSTRLVLSLADQTLGVDFARPSPSGPDTRLWLKKE